MTRPQIDYKKSKDLILKQQENLVKIIPNLAHYFIDIEIPHWGLSLPFLPIRCFRDFALHTGTNSHTTLLNSPPLKAFFSSGTTGNARAQHIFSPSALKKYEVNTCAGFEKFLNRQGFNAHKVHIISLVPTPQAWPTSSLAAMIDMFAKNSFNILYCDIENTPETLLSLLKQIPTHHNCVIFGTTFHHLSLANNSNKNFHTQIQAEFSRLCVSIIDTGGTKGRTQAYTLSQVQQQLEGFYSSSQFSFLSEYGMCELSSQAWSLKKQHEGSFECNDTLHPFCLSLENKCAQPHLKKGFLAFYDQVNTESWPCIITEDIGYSLDDHSFHLLGRGPDASIKGCSLNVKENFHFDATTQKIYLKPQQNKAKSLNLSELVKRLASEKKWDVHSIDDLLTIAASLENPIPIQHNFKANNILIICAANTPIAWLFPYIIACTHAASSITLKIPTLRLDDYLANSMSEKTRDLIDIVKDYFPNTKTYLDANKSLSHTFHEYDTMLIFGTDATLHTISQQIDPTQTKFIGKGDIKNSLLIDMTKHEPSYIAKLCSLWNGRGCLTPIALFLENDEQTHKWVEEFNKKLKHEFSQRLTHVPASGFEQFMHAHNKAYVSSQIRQLSLQEDAHLKVSSHTCLVDFVNIHSEKLEQFMPEFDFGGCGFIYLFPSTYKNKFPQLKQLNILPSIQDWDGFN